MKYIELIEFIEDNKQGNVIYFPDEIYNNLNYEQAEEIKNHFRGSTYFMLPKSELDFFDWLKVNDPKVWDDIWCDDLSPLHCVSIDLLPYMIKHNSGFPICDLVENDNYYFSLSAFVDKESALMVETIKKRFLNKDTLTTAQALLMEISFAPTDIWHFAYKYKLNLQAAKDSVAHLVDDNMLHHYKSAEELAFIIEI